MTHIPKKVLGKPLENLLLMSRGKVRDTYLLPKFHDLLLVVASDRISIFDFVLPLIVLSKGMVLTAINIFWAKILEGIIHQDIVAYGAEIDKFLPQHLRGDSELQKRALVAKRLDMCDYEGIVRFVLTGSAVKPYQETGVVCGHMLPSGLNNGDLLPYPLFTPSTKAKEGHDVHIDANTVALHYGHRHERLILQIAQVIQNFCTQRDIMLADTKFEVGHYNGILTLGDERGTPDSSRFWDAVKYITRSKGKLPPSLDKQTVRDTASHLSKLDPTKAEDLDQVSRLKFDSSITANTTQTYRYIFWRLLGEKLEAFQRNSMGIAVEDKPLKVDVLLGSRSDLPQAEHALDFLKAQSQVDFRVHILSCDRNPEILRIYARAKDINDVDVIIAGAGMSARLPSALKSWLCHLKKGDKPVIGVGFEGKDENANLAARLAIEEVPEKPVELGLDGSAYFGKQGCLEAAKAAVRHEFLPREFKSKPAEMNIKV